MRALHDHMQMVEGLASNASMNPTRPQPTLEAPPDASNKTLPALQSIHQEFDLEDG